MLRIFTPVKIQRLRPGLNPQTWVPKASMLTTRPPKPSNCCVRREYIEYCSPSLFVYPFVPAVSFLYSSFGSSTVEYFDELADPRLIQLAILSSCFLDLLSSFLAVIPLNTNRNIPPLCSTNDASGLGDRNTNSGRIFLSVVLYQLKLC